MTFENYEKTNWEEELSPILEKLNHYVFENKLLIDIIPEDIEKVYIEMGEMQQTDHAFVIGDKINQTLTPKQFVALKEYLKQIETLSVKIQWNSSADDYGIVIIKPIIN